GVGADDLAGVHGVAEAFHVAFGDLGVVLVEGVGGDELGLADDPVEGGVFGGEAEVAGEAEPFAFGAGAAFGGLFGHGVPDAAVEVGDQFVEDLLFALEVDVEGAL